MAYINNMEKLNNEGGACMQRVAFNVSQRDINYLQNVVWAGRMCQTKVFERLPEEEKAKVLAGVFSKKLSNLMVKENKKNSMTIMHTPNAIKISKRISVNINGFGAKEKKVDVNMLVFTLTDFKFGENNLTCEVNFFPESLKRERILGSVPENALARFIGPVTFSYKAPSENDLMQWKEDVIDKCKQTMAMPYVEAKLLAAFFDLLCKKGLSNICGSEAVHMSTIFGNAEEAYPMFAKLPISDQISILDKGYYNSRRYSSKDTQDIHILAKGTFEEILRRNLIKTLVIQDTDASGKYFLKKEHRKHRILNGKLFERNALIWVEYEKVSARMSYTRGFTAFDLWNILTRGAASGEAA